MASDLIKVNDDKQHLIFECVGGIWVETTTLEPLTEINFKEVKKVSFRARK